MKDRKLCALCRHKKIHKENFAHPGEQIITNHKHKKL